MRVALFGQPDHGGVVGLDDAEPFTPALDERVGAEQELEVHLVVIHRDLVEILEGQPDLAVLDLHLERGLGRGQLVLRASRWSSSRPLSATSPPLISAAWEITLANRSRHLSTGWSW